jgi:Asp-tRNA(Asn)/Glu-tRNA(Gln) amidotransferase C subunit
VDTTGITPTNSVIQKENTLREDALQEKPLSRERLLACSKQSVIQKQITIPNIM